jgi:glyoxylase-like metal-dependent hydrolase (beta-lactamase superfamily II)
MANSEDFRLATIVSLPFGENSYVAWLAGRDDCLVVDPGLEPDKILSLLDEQGLAPAAILNTHGHCDHIAGNGAMKKRWPTCPIVIGRGDAPKLTNAQLNLSADFGVPLTSPPADLELDAGQEYEAAGFTLAVREIPGHSSGHVVFVWHDHRPKYVFGGDVLFHGSIGRTDFPDGSFQLLAEGIHRDLFTLPDDTIVLPGHGQATTIGQEKESNPFVGRRAGR